MGEISLKTGNNARNGGKNSLNRLIRCVCGKKIGPDPRNFNQRVSLGRNDLLIRTFPKALSEQPFNWRTILMAKPTLFGFCNQGFIVLNAHESVLLHESQRNHSQSELYSKYLELELKDRKLNITPFKDSSYNTVRSGEAISFLCLSDFSLNDQQLEVEIFYRYNQYNILFYRNDETVPFSDELQSTMESCGFIVLADSKDYDPEDWQCRDDNYLYYCEDPERALAIISDLCARLAKL